MAVQQNKKSPSKRGMHRSHNALGQPGTAIEPTTGEVHLRHHISPTGFYRGRKGLTSQAAASAFRDAAGRHVTPPGGAAREGVLAWPHVFTRRGPTAQAAKRRLLSGPRVAESVHP